jgi:phage shock protein PspC (stress-responsive transcriptional regulator)
VISGLCNGVAAWLGVDVTPVRVIAVLLAFLTGGMAVLVYVVLMFIVPYASTSEERAAAHGLPFNARVLVERAKQKYSQFADSARDPAARAGWRKEWRREWRHARAEMRHAAREARAEWRAGRSGTASPASPATPATPAIIAARTITGIVMAAVGVLVAAFTVAWVLGLVSFMTTGALFGWTLPFQAPFWAVLIALFVLFGIITAPLRMMRKSAGCGMHPGPWPAFAALEGMASIAFIVALLWYASHHMDEIRAFIEQLRSGAFRLP